MTISTKVRTMIDNIIETNHTDAEWLRIQKELEAFLKELSEEELRYFAESGAGEALYMVCSGINKQSV